MSTALRLTITSMITFMILFLIVRIVFSVGMRDIPFLEALVSLETWLPIVIFGAFYGLIMFFINKKKYPEG
ncbi:MAG TPA: hypothetical protein K8V35_03160 [Aliicoccus persicus]|uniref:Uncharacterized protein n=1 Tax=Aliicoccus persicus TaxID=930138 RepID=A0A921B5Y9_9STAP|nr:hypothetical protein [Aliicoccus persicus]